MTSNLPAITGIGSVSPYGPLTGLIPQSPAPVPESITAWPTAGLRRAFLVKPFRPASVVPGLKTRRLDRLSAWALVASSLALQDAGIDLREVGQNEVDRSRVAVVFATGFGCAELTEAFYQSAAANGWSGTDPSPFPEGLANSPASHVALLHGLRGPNITVGSKGVAGESALIQAASLLRHGQADLAIVLAGDTLTRAVYAWYESAGLLSAACYNAEPVPGSLPEAGGFVPSGFIPSEGVVALVLEPAGRREVRAYAHFNSGRWAAGGQPVETIRQMLDGVIPSLIICAGSGSPCANGSTTAWGRDISGPDAVIVPPNTAAAGLPDTSAFLHLILALSTRPCGGPALLLGSSGERGFAALLLELP
jgi:Beta-ketoacyl synthase, N-terminal domain